MPINRNTLMRVRIIDECLQRRQREWTLEDLREACEKELLEKEGICGISTRTIQRDIELMRSDKLGYNAPIIVKNKKYYTYEDPDYSITKLPLSKEDLNELSSALEIIKHYNGFSNMSGQEDILTRMQDKIACQTDNNKVVYIETNNKLKGLNFLGPLFDAVKRKDALIIEYKSFKAKRESRIYISPYILKEYNNRWFVIGVSPQKEVKTLALDRIIEIRKDDNHKYVDNTVFNPEKYLNEMIGVTRDLESNVETVIFWVDAHQTPYIETKPFHESQEIEKENEDGSKVFRIRIIINYELERKLLGYGSHIKVIEPLHLKQRIANEVVNRIEEQYPQYKGKINVLDVFTPITLKRYTNATRGAYMGLFTHKQPRLSHPGTISGLHNLYLAGQWLESPGGLPFAAASGKWVAIRICKQDGVKFDYQNSLLYKKATI